MELFRSADPRTLLGGRSWLFVTNTRIIKANTLHFHRNATSHVIASLLLRLLSPEVLSTHLYEHIAGSRAVAFLSVRGFV